MLYSALPRVHCTINWNIPYSHILLRGNPTYFFRGGCYISNLSTHVDNYINGHGIDQPLSLTIRLFLEGGHMKQVIYIYTATQSYLSGMLYITDHWTQHMLINCVESKRF